MRNQRSAITTLATALAAIVSGAALASCGGSGTPTPKVSDFAAGACREAAPAVLGVGRLAARARHQHDVRSDVKAELTTAQSVLRKVSPRPKGAETANLITAIGFLRLGLDSHTYRPQLLTDVINAQRAMQNACLAGNTN